MPEKPEEHDANANGMSQLTPAILLNSAVRSTKTGLREIAQEDAETRSA